MSNWKEIIKSGVESVEIYSKDQVKVTCTNKDIGEEVFIAIRTNYQNLEAEPLKYIKGTNYKDFRFKFETSAEAALFLVALQNIIAGKEDNVPSTSVRVLPNVTLLPQPVKRVPVEKPSDDADGTVQTSSGSSGEDESEVEVIAGETETEAETETETEETPVTGNEGIKSKISKKTVIIAAVAVAVLILLVVLLTQNRK